MERLYRAAKELRGLTTQAEVAAALGQSSQTVNNWEARGVSKLGALAAQTEFGCSATWILTGAGSMTVAPAAVVDKPVPSPLAAMSVRAAAPPTTTPIRFVKIDLRAGATGFVTEFPPEDGGIFELPVTVLEELGIEPHWLMAMRVKGPSMKPMMDDGEIVVVSRKHVDPIDECVYAFNYDGEPLIKQLIKHGSEWCLHSHNPKFKDLRTRDVYCDIVGMVVWQPPRILAPHAALK